VADEPATRTLGLGRRVDLALRTRIEKSQKNQRLEDELERTRLALDIVGKHTALWRSFQERGQRVVDDEILIR